MQKLMSSLGCFLVSFLTLHFPLIIFALNQEGLYLQKVKSSLSDPTGSLSSWSDRDVTPCNWTRVTCTGISVTSVNLSGAFLAGNFPISLCSLPSLTNLSLSDNSINSSLPLSISRCRNLVYIDLSQNLLLGSIPSSLADIPNLRYLNLGGNSFSGEIPASFGRFQHLEDLIITGNELNGRIPGFLGNISSLKSLELAFNPFAPSQLAPELGNLTNLEVFWFASCNLVGPIPESFVKLSRISNFDVSYNRLTGPVPSLIFQWRNVVQIELYNNSFSGDLPEGWSNMTNLRRFDASTNGLTGKIPDELCQLPLESLNLYENQLVGGVPESISQSPNLYELKLFTNRLTGSLPSDLGKFSALQTLDLCDNNLTGIIPETLCVNGALEELILMDNFFSGNIPASLGSCRSLLRVRLGNNQLSGEVPAGFWGLPNVYLVELVDNSLSGGISRAISGATNLSSLVISRNKFSGPIPLEIGTLSNLIEFSASDNELNGKIPATLGELRQLGKLDLGNNMLSGEIPTGIQFIKQLNELNLSNNKLYGEIPDEIGRLPSLNYLDFSGNHFSGEIPPSLQNLKLNMLNLSNNQLSGDIPPLFDKDFYKDSFLGNPGLCGHIADHCLGKPGKGREAYKWMLRFIYISAGMVFLVGILLFLLKYRDVKTMKKHGVISKWTSFHKLGFCEFEIMDYLDEDNVIGKGSSGKVYKAVLSNGETVAVKKLKERINKDAATFGSTDPLKDKFEAEVKTLGKIRHKNIVKLWCCCNSGECKLLVYEYMPNGSLGDLLHSTKKGLLKWPVRFKIALDTAEGLSYLHHDCVPPILHRDVKSSNILLDEDFGAKISDFGIAKVVQGAPNRAESITAIAGSCGYIAPEYAYTLRVSEKSDVYSFGVVILELVTGRRPGDPRMDEDLARWVCTTLDKQGIDAVVDSSLDSRYKEQIGKVLNIGLHCCSPLPINRPSMRRVVKMLEESYLHNAPETMKEVKLST